jgi:hypothetical protein
MVKYPDESKTIYLLAAKADKSPLRNAPKRLKSGKSRGRKRMKIK